jgi:hypothetical protein
MSNDNSPLTLSDEFPINLADFILCGCLYPPFERQGLDPVEAVCHPRFISRFRFWQPVELVDQTARWVDEVVVTLNRANTTPR